MSDIKLFKISGSKTTEIPGSRHELEKPLQQLFEDNLETLLGVRFLASEHSTGRTHAGRIDTLGIDENGCPVIVEYKRSISENVVNQGLYYLDWLLDHQAEFKLIVLDRMGKSVADAIDWSAPRLICIASDYKKYDEHAIRQINRNIDLIRYRRFGSDLLALELATTVTSDFSATQPGPTSESNRRSTDKSVAEAIAEMSPEIAAVYHGLCQFIGSLGDDVVVKQLKLYVAFRRIRNFATLVVQKKGLRLFLHLEPSSVDLQDGWARDVSNIGHWGTGSVELTLESLDDLHRAQPLVARAYEEQ